MSEEWLSPEQEEINAEEVTFYEGLIDEQRKTVEDIFRFSVDTATEYKCSESTVDDWLDMPEITPKLIIELQRHAKAVADHLRYKDTLETTADLRSMCEKNFKVSLTVQFSFNHMICVSIGARESAQSIQKQRY